MSETKKKILYCSLVVLSAICFLLPTVSNVFIYDDAKWMIESDLVYSYKNVPSFFTTKELGSLYRPVLLLSLWSNQAIFGHSPVAFHAMSLFLHALVSLLFFLILSKLWGYSYKSLIPALIFAVHPIHVDTVAFAYNRSEILALIFILLGFVFLLRDKCWKDYFSFNEEQLKTPKGFTIFAASFFFLLAMLSKETAVIGIIIFVLFIAFKFVYLRKIPKFNPVLLSAIIFSLVLILYFVMRWFALKTIAARPSEMLYFKERNALEIFFTMARVFADYIGMLIAPILQRIDYSDYEMSKSIIDKAVIIALIVHLLLFAVSVWQFRIRPFLSFCLLAFYASLLPVSQIIKFLDIKAERFLYMPSIFFCLVLSYPLIHIKPGNKYYKVLMVGFIVLMFAYGIKSFHYSTFFQSENRLYSKMVKQYPESSKFNYCIGNHWARQRKCGRAIPYLEKSILLRENVEAHSPLGICYHMLGNRDKAISVLSRGLTLRPNTPLLIKNMAYIYYLENQFDKALLHINKALKLDSDDEKAISLRKKILMKMMRY